MYTTGITFYDLLHNNIPTLCKLAFVPNGLHNSIILLHLNNHSVHLLAKHHFLGILIRF